MDIILALALTTHVNLSKDFNEFHPHIRFQHNSFIAGAFHNSLEDPSYYVGLTSNITKNLSVEYGATTGYNDISDVVPFGRLVYEFTDYSRVFVSPAVEKRRSNNGLVFGVELFF